MQTEGLNSLPENCAAQSGGCGCDAAAGCSCGATAGCAAAVGFVLLLTKNFSFLVTAGAALRLSFHPSDRASIASIVLRSDTGRPGFAPFPLGRFGSPAGTSEPPEPLLRFGLLNVSASAPDMPG